MSAETGMPSPNFQRVTWSPADVAIQQQLGRRPEDVVRAGVSLAQKRCVSRAACLLACSFPAGRQEAIISCRHDADGPEMAAMLADDALWNARRSREG